MTKMTTRSTTNLTRLFDDCDENINIRNDNKNVLEELTVDLLDLPRMEIITRWLKGEQRDKIASAMGLGAGTISAIISEWKAEIGIPNANTLRQFSTELRRLGITASQCVLGCKILGVLRKLRVDEENLESFVSQVYQKCQSRSITPEAIVECSQEDTLHGRKDSNFANSTNRSDDDRGKARIRAGAANIEKGSSNRQERTRRSIEEQPDYHS